MKETQDVKSTILHQCEPDPEKGLTKEQVLERNEAGAMNCGLDSLTPGVSQIIKKNTLTLFNFINLFLAITIILVGHPENTLFLGVAICNSLMGIFQELRAKKTLDKLSILAQAQANVIRDGTEVVIPQDEIVLDDIVVLTAGNQVCADALVVSSTGLEIDESLLTGETDRIRKDLGSTVLSGTYVTRGSAHVRVTAVGADNYANTLTSEAKQKGKPKSKLLNILNKIIKVLTIIIIPLGAILFYSKYSNGATIQSAVLGTSAAMIGMIPNGLVLLTGVTMTVGAMTLAKKKALVQSLSSIETLARVDVLCLDKTGTITDGTLEFQQMKNQNGYTDSEIKQAISELMGALQDKNATAKSLLGSFGGHTDWKAETLVPFSSERKWSGAVFADKGSYILGAPNIVFAGSDQPFLEEANDYANQGYRVLCLGYSLNAIEEEMLPEGLTCMALLVLSERIREDAKETFQYFSDEGVTLKVISGDNPRTVSAVAAKAGLEGAERKIDMKSVDEHANYMELTEEYTVFGHVTPQQKKELIMAMQNHGHITCMTGDGINDILAMRESDCSVSMVGGSDAARSACDFVLMNDNFSSMVEVLKEGRRVINNIDRVVALYLVNTIYSILFAVIYTFMSSPYPFAPLQMTPVNALTVGIPSFFLAMQVNYARPDEKLISNIFEHAFPAAITVVFNTLYIQLASILFEIPHEESSTMIVFLIGVVGFYLLLRITKPRTKNTKILLSVLVAAFALLFIFFGEHFSLTSLFTRNAFFYLPLIYFSYYIHSFLETMCHKFLELISK